MLKMNINRFGKAIGLLLAFTMMATGVFCVPFDNNPFITDVKADTQLTVNLGEASKNGNIVTFPNASISDCGSNISSMMFTVTDGSIVGGSEKWNFTDILPEHKTVTKVWTTPISISEANTFLQGVQFKFAEGMSVTVKVDANEMRLPSSANISAYEPVKGEGQHYYMYVGTSWNKSWTSAYNDAKGFVFMGMKGYLVTVTSKEEDKVLDNISTEGAWAGGARVQPSVTLDADSANNYKPTGTTYSWRWVCGPEAGQLIPLDSNCKAYGELSEKTTEGYQNWGIDSSTLKVNQPDGTGTSGNFEWCLQLHFYNSYNPASWNDLAVTAPWSGLVSGYYVEFSDYDGGHVAGYSQTKTALATASHIHSWTYASEYNSDMTKADALVYCANNPQISLCSYSGEANAKHFSVDAKDAGYTGDAYDASNITTQGFDEISSLTGANQSPVSYYTDKELKVPTDQTCGASSPNGAPTEIGTYYAAITITDGTDTSRSAVAYDQFSITKGTRPQGTVTLTQDDYVYGSTPSVPTLSGLSSETPEYIKYWYNTTGSTDVAGSSEWDKSDPPKLGAGKYYMFAEIGATEKYDVSYTAADDFTVSPLPVNIEWDNTELIYNGKEQEPTAKCKDSDIIPGDVVNVSLTGKQKKAGSYNSVAAIDNSNYTIANNTGEQAYTIAKAKLELTPGDQTIPAGKKIQSDVYAIMSKGLCGTDKLVELYASNPITVECSTPAYAQPGDYELEIKGADGVTLDNYDVTIKKGRLKVEKGTSGTKIDDIPGSGEVIVSTRKEEGLPETKLNPLKKETARELVDDDEKQAVENGSDLLIYLELTDAAPHVTQEEIDNFEQIKTPEYTLAEEILDLSLYKRLVNNASGVSTEPERIESIENSFIDVTVTLPDNLLNKDSSKIRKYEVLRMHEYSSETKYERIPSSYSNGRITFKTNRFSDYAIAYYDTNKPITPDPPQGGGNDSPSGNNNGNNPGVTTVIPVLGAPTAFVSPKTGDTNEIFILIAFLLAGVGIAVFGHRNGKTE